MENDTPTSGFESQLPVELEARLCREIKAHGSVAAGAAACGIDEAVARPAAFAATQGGRLIRDEVVIFPDGTIEHVKEWSRPDGKLAFLLLDELSIADTGLPWGGGDSLN